MPPLPLKAGFYQSRNLIANAQRCTNLYPEKNPEDSPQPFAMYQTPGTVVLGQTPSGGTWRGLYEATNSSLYGVLNSNVYYIDPNFNFTQIGGPLVSNALTPVRSRSGNRLAARERTSRESCPAAIRLGRSVRTTASDRWR